MKQDMRIAVTKRMIKDALLRLLETKTLDKIKVSALCEESGVNRATFYRHYETLQEVLREIETEFIRQMPHPGKQPCDMAQARSYLEAVCTYFYNHAALIKLLFLNGTDDDMMQGLNAFYRSFLELWSTERRLSDLDEDTAKVIIAVVSGGGHCLLRQWIMGDIQKTPGEIAEILCKIIRWPNHMDISSSEM